MLRFVGSTWAWLPKPVRVRGMAVCRPLDLPELVTRPGHL